MKVYTKPQIKTITVGSDKLLSGSMEAKEINNFEETEQATDNTWNQKYSAWEN